MCGASGSIACSMTIKMEHLLSLYLAWIHPVGRWGIAEINILSMRIQFGVSLTSFRGCFETYYHISCKLKTENERTETKDNCFELFTCSKVSWKQNLGLLLCSCVEKFVSVYKIYINSCVFTSKCYVHNLSTPSGDPIKWTSLLLRRQERVCLVGGLVT